MSGLHVPEPDGPAVRSPQLHIVLGYEVDQVKQIRTYRHANQLRGVNIIDGDQVVKFGDVGRDVLDALAVCDRRPTVFSPPPPTPEPPRCDHANVTLGVDPGTKTTHFAIYCRDCNRLWIKTSGEEA